MIRFEASCLTLDLYPNQWIHVYTDGSVWVDKMRAAYGVLIRYPDGSATEISGACREPVFISGRKISNSDIAELSQYFLPCIPSKKMDNSIEKYPHTI